MLSAPDYDSTPSHSPPSYHLHPNRIDSLTSNLPPHTNPPMTLPRLPLTLLPTIRHLPTPRTSLRILLPTNRAIHLPKNIIRVHILPRLLRNSRPGLQYVGPDAAFARGGAAPGCDVDDHHGRGEVEV